MAVREDRALSPGLTPAPLSRQLSVDAADGCNINVTEFGRGQDVLILVHGFGENGYSWGELPSDLTSAYCVLAVDLRGHGDSQWDPAAQYRRDLFVSDLTRLVDQLQLDSFCVAGHSLGASIALRLATLRPRQVRKLVLVEFNIEVIADEVLDFILAQFTAQFRVYDSPDEYHAFLETQRPAADRVALLRYARHAVRRRQGGGYEVKCDPELRRLTCDLRDARESGRDRYALSGLGCPLLLVRGSGSAILTKAGAQQIVNLVPGARQVAVAGAGHSVMLDRPREFTDAVAPFLLDRPIRQS
jgi:3-oxoadipate enol-lactonase